MMLLPCNMNPQWALWYAKYNIPIAKCINIMKSYAVEFFLKTINGLIPAHVKFCHQIHFGAKLTKKFSFPTSDFRTASEALCI